MLHFRNKIYPKHLLGNYFCTRQIYFLILKTRLSEPYIFISINPSLIIIYLIILLILIFHSKPLFDCFQIIYRLSHLNQFFILIGYIGKSIYRILISQNQFHFIFTVIYFGILIYFIYSNFLLQSPNFFIFPIIVKFIDEAFNFLNYSYVS